MRNTTQTEGDYGGICAMQQTVTAARINKQTPSDYLHLFTKLFHYLCYNYYQKYIPFELFTHASI